jgi:hypothetical protein
MSNYDPVVFDVSVLELVEFVDVEPVDESVDEAVEDELSFELLSDFDVFWLVWPDFE